MKGMETLCKDQGETLGNMIAQSCLFKHVNKDNVHGKKIMSNVFTEVAQELGVQKAFNELILDELWNKQVHMMSVPYWMLLLCKLESKILDEGWQVILNRTHLGKSGVSIGVFIIITIIMVVIVNIMMISLKC